MALISYVVKVPFLGNEEGSVVTVDSELGEKLVADGYLEEATEEHMAGGEDVEEQEVPGAVENAAKSLEKQLNEGIEKATKIVAEKLNAKAVHAPTISTKVAAEPIDHTWGFKSLGDFAKCAVASEVGQLSARNRIEQSQKAADHWAKRVKGWDRKISKDAGYSTGGGPSISYSDGGILIPPVYAQQLFEKVKNVTNLYDMCSEYPFANTTEVPCDNETGFNSGVKAYWQTEDTTVSQTKPVISNIELKAKTLMAFVPVTEQQLQDNAYVLDSWLGRKVPTKMIDQLNLNVLYGTGGGANVIGNAATIVVTRATANRISFADVNNMRARLHSDNLANAAYFISPSYYPELQKLSFPDTSGTVPVFVQTSTGYPNISGPVCGTLNGLPVIMCHALQALGSKGDILLADLSAVAKIQKQIDSAVSIHFYFDRYTNLFRFVMRANTVSQWLTTYTRMDGVTASPFVVLSGTSQVPPVVS